VYFLELASKPCVSAGATSRIFLLEYASKLENLARSSSLPHRRGTFRSITVGMSSAKDWATSSADNFCKVHVAGIGLVNLEVASGGATQDWLGEVVLPAFLVEAGENLKAKEGKISQAGFTNIISFLTGISISPEH
jgi:hypothetical protein